MNAHAPRQDHLYIQASAKLSTCMQSPVILHELSKEASVALQASQYFWMGLENISFGMVPAAVHLHQLLHIGLFPHPRAARIHGSHDDAWTFIRQLLDSHTLANISQTLNIERQGKVWTPLLHRQPWFPRTPIYTVPIATSLSACAWVFTHIDSKHSISTTFRQYR